MKKIGILIIGLAFLMGCVEEKDTRNNIFDPFQTSAKVESQYFDLDTISLKEIEGKKGTKIYFLREFFDVDSTDKISLELKEFYNISDLIKNNIRTITEDNELLESSGVIYLNFTKNGEELKLKDSATMRVRFPFSLSEQDKIFNGKMDSISQMSWSETKAYFMVLRFNKKYQIDMGYNVTLDSLPYYQELWRKQDSIYNETVSSYNNIDKKIGAAVSLTNLGWINVDRFVEKPTTRDFSLTNSLKVEGIVMYVVFDNLNSFTSYYPVDTENIILTDVPVLENTSLIAVGIKNKQLYAQKILVDDKDSMQLSLQPINQTELDKLFGK
ncbi:hypothetical protein LCGC14_0559820 [marine sediment metagenome]|uniref:Lipoprotein n=1 Tax=marine sediment metagenome TaxID=412755 RepID=A0A0F9RM83_9ZZZZ|nr:hypothetical protein [Maribacter sp.]HDZ07207.1 hypothetical protein [Maribacter sp.]HEC40735.1 hypothetical protein [bacterium]